MGTIHPVRSCREVIKAGVIPNALSTNAGAELAPYKELATGFFGSLAAQSAFSKIYNAGDFTPCAVENIDQV